MQLNISNLNPKSQIWIQTRKGYTKYDKLIEWIYILQSLQNLNEQKYTGT